MRANYENTLVLIPARAGSKGVPKKNSKPFAEGSSLVVRAVDLAKTLFDSKNIVLSTDDEELLEQTKHFFIQQIKRDPHLSTDKSGMLEVMLDAVDKQSSEPLFLLLLQPTSPFRTRRHIEKAFELFQEDDQAVVSVNEPKGHPFYTLFQEENGFIQKFQKNLVVRRQDLPPMYDVNGLIYLFRIADLRKMSWVDFERIRPFVVSGWEAIDIDTPEDWWLAETIHYGLETGRSSFP